MDFRSPVLKCVPFLSPDTKTHRFVKEACDKEHIGQTIRWYYPEWSLRSWPPWCSCFWCQVSTLWLDRFPLCSSEHETYSSWRRTNRRWRWPSLHPAADFQSCFTLSNTCRRRDGLPYRWHFCSSSAERLAREASAQRCPQCCNRTWRRCSCGCDRESHSREPHQSLLPACGRV